MIYRPLASGRRRRLENNLHWCKKRRNHVHIDDKIIIIIIIIIIILLKYVCWKIKNIVKIDKNTNMKIN